MDYHTAIRHLPPDLPNAHQTSEGTRRSVDIGSRAMEADVGFIDPPLCTNRPPMRTSGLLESGQEALHPAINRTTVDDEAALGEPLHDVGVAQAIPELPADGQGDHIVREGMPGECTTGTGRETSTALGAAPPLSAQACLSISSRSLASAPHALHDYLPRSIGG